MKVDGVSLQGEQVFKAKMPVSAQLDVEEIPQDSPPTAQIDEPCLMSLNQTFRTQMIQKKMAKAFCACCRKGISRAYQIFDFGSTSSSG